MANSPSKPIRVAVASNDGTTIRQHFAQVGRFGVYEIQDGGFFLVDVRENTPPCHLGKCRKPESYLTETIDSISDCHVVLAAEIGPCAQSRLAQKGIVSLQATGPIDAALAALSKNIVRLFPIHQFYENPLEARVE